ncbi:MAG: 16S rRNA (cytosine(1407)-C(5))-methyltransferase RsmF [Gammaproteobacteria bacterium]|nr:16S rRNA (cytosine(1407)-C(5))-methyltransferase RsmF [Gammaproteobacteria bacterium]
MATISKDFIEHIAKQGLDANQLESFLAFCQQPLRRSFRINSLHFDAQQVCQNWKNSGYQLIPVPWAKDAFWVDEEHKPLPAGLGNFIDHQQGQFYIQEASSMLPVTALFAACPTPKMVLDVAAAPGSKTTQIAAMMDNQGLVMANELSSSRLKGLFSNVQRCGVANVCLTHADGRVFGDKTPEQFDAILLDAPCGGEGTVRKDPDALESWSLDSVLAMAELQKELIISAFKALKPGGTLVYSTCTLSREENQNVCQHLLDTYVDEVSIFNLQDLFDGAEKATTEEGYLHIFPQIFDSEGFFVACFQKANKPQTEQTPIKNTRFPFTPIDKKTAIDFKNYAQNFGWDINIIRKNLWQRKNEVWYFPDGIENLIGKIKMDRIGAKLAESHKKGFRLEHQAAIAFGTQFTKSQFELSAQEANEYYLGRDIYPENSLAELNGELLLTYQNNPIGLGKKISNRIKNNLPRDLVRDGSFYQL